MYCFLAKNLGATNGQRPLLIGCLLLFGCLPMLALGQSALPVAATTDSSLFFVGGQLGLANIIAHSPELAPISRSHPTTAVASYSWINGRAAAWENAACYSRLGVEASFTHFGLPEVLGNAYTASFFVEPLLGYRAPVFLSVRGGIGASYLNRVYDEETNPQNTFFSSPISFLLQAGLMLNWRPHNHWLVQLGGRYDHISNGGMRQPNRGMNFPGLVVGAAYTPQPWHLEVRRSAFEGGEPAAAYLRLFGTFRDSHESSPGSSRRNLEAGVAGGARKRVFRLTAFSVGAEMAYSPYFREKSLANNGNGGAFLGGVVVGHHLLFGRFDFNQQWGTYVVRERVVENQRFFQRYELAWRASRRLVLGASLKAHGHVAQNIDLRIGWAFR